MTDGATPSAALSAWLEGFAEGAMNPDEVDAFVRSVDAEILAAIPEIAADRTLAEELHASTRAHWRSFLVGLGDEYQLTLPTAAVALSLSIARRNLEISVLLKVYRIANKAVFRYLMDRTEPAGLPAGLRRDEALLAVWLRAEQWIDDSVEQLIEHYTRERASLAAGVQARRAQTIEALLAGAPPTAEHARILGHNLRQWQTAFVLAGAPGTDETAPLYEVAQQACALLGLPRPLTHLAGNRELWGWTSTPERPVVDLPTVIGLLTDAGLHLATGGPMSGSAAFRISHLQAVAAHRVVLRTAAPAHAYADIELATLLGDGELARDLVRRELAPLLSGTKGEDGLRETALTYLRSGLNVDATADRLFVHPNTVRYRISRIEEQLGHRISERAGVLDACLSWVDVYGADAVG
ncbi:PucR family transcriptional regulator [Nocardioides ultimimeridianus]